MKSKSDGTSGSGKSGDGGGKTSDNGLSYGIDLTSTEVQQMSEKRAAKDKLSETSKEWLQGATIFPEGTEMNKRTYKDFVDYIGCDATEYKFDDSRNTRVYTWKAEDSDNSALAVWFAEIGGTWRLAYTGSTNL